MHLLAPICVLRFVTADSKLAASNSIMMKNKLLLLAACSLLTATSATFVMLGDSFSDDGHGANPVIQDALSQPGVRSSYLLGLADSASVPA